MPSCPSCGQENPDAAVVCARCGAELRRARTVPAMPAQDAFAENRAALRTTGPLGPGRLVDGKYAILSVLGEGGMGIVYLARDVHTDAHVVLKALHSALAHDEEYRARVRLEARALAHIDHPNVVRLNALVTEGDDLLLVMQYVEGRSLDRIIAEHTASGTPFPVDHVRSLRLRRPLRPSQRRARARPRSIRSRRSRASG